MHHKLLINLNALLQSLTAILMSRLRIINVQNVMLDMTYKIICAILVLLIALTKIKYNLESVNLVLVVTF